MAHPLYLLVSQDHCTVVVRAEITGFQERRSFGAGGSKPLIRKRLRLNVQ